MQEQMIARAKALLSDSTVDRVLGWKVGEFSYDLTPAVFESAEELDNEFVYNTFSAANLSKYLVKQKSPCFRKTLRLLQPSATY